jgi:RNA recognition motif-containing protein
MSNPIQVKYAGEPPKAGGSSGAGSAPATTHKLFIGMVPKTFTEDDLRPIFTPFGEIKDMNILRGSDGQSRGCGFILFKDVPSAVQAITTLDGKIKLEGSSSNLVVQFATSGQKSQTPAVPAVTPQIPVMGGYPTMVQQPQTFMDPYGLGAAAYTQYVLPQTPTGYTFATTPAIPASTGGLGSNKEGPPGANLFIYHLPKDYTDASLMALFSQFGAIVSSKIVTDKDTGESKGYGFISYESPESAQLAIANTNGMQLHGGKRLKVEVKNARTTGSRPY